MKCSATYLLSALPALGQLAAAQSTMAPLMGALGYPTVAGNGSGPGNGTETDGKYMISAEGIELWFVPYGASISNLFINDTKGDKLDIVLGWDNATYYTEDPRHPYYGPVPGRYANRIKNSTFELDGQTYHITSNEHLDTSPDTLHGGVRGWSWRNWTVVAHTTDSITFSLVDPDGDQGFPGEVISYVTYTVEAYTWHLRMVAIPTTKTTPIMLTSHTYWNLDGFTNPSTGTILNHTLSLPYSGERIGVDGNLIPDGTILPNQPNSVNDFWTKPKQIGTNFSEALGNCGTNCTGYDTCFLINRPSALPSSAWAYAPPVAQLSSNYSGITVSIFTDQDAFQVYSCGGMNGTTPIKATQGTPGRRTVPQYGCVVMEVEDWIDAINQPEWGRQDRQIFGPGGDPYVLQARYEFSVAGKDVAPPAPTPSGYYPGSYGYGGMRRAPGGVAYGAPKYRV